MRENQGRIIGIVAALAFAAGAARAQVFGSDNGANSPYGVGNYNTQNGGSGFQAWSNSATSGSGGFFIANSNGNGGGGSPNIGTSAFGLFANSGAMASAIRPFASALVTNNQFSVDFDNGFIDNGSVTSLILANSSGQTRFAFSFTGGTSNYQFTDAGGTTASTLGFADTGFSLQFTLTGTDTYSFTAKNLNSSATQTVSGTLAGTGGSGVDRMVAQNNNAGNGSANNLYVNNLSLATIPEPASLALIGLALLPGAALLRRRR